MALRATLRSADEDTFEGWFRTNHVALQRYCRHILFDQAAAADVAQEAMLRAWARRDEFASEGQVRPWLWRVARNLCIDTMRAGERVVPSATLPEQEAEHADPLSPIEQEDDRRAVRRAMVQLSPRHQDLLYRREVQGVGYAELAEEMGVSVEGARAVVFRARRCLQQRLEADQADTVPAA